MISELIDELKEYCVELSELGCLAIYIDEKELEE